MTREFIEKVVRLGSVDTKKYRYVAVEAYDHESQWLEIKRIELEELDTTAATDGWKIVATIK